MTDDLVKRLRDREDLSSSYGITNTIFMEAADRIEGLMAVIASMESEVNLLNCLRHAGVDNWDGYEYALELMEEGDD